MSNVLYFGETKPAFINPNARVKVVVESDSSGHLVECCLLSDYDTRDIMDKLEENYVISLYSIPERK